MNRLHSPLPAALGLVMLGATLACAHAAIPVPGANPSGTGANSRNENQESPAEERREVTVQIKTEALVAPDSIPEGARTVEFSNDTKVSWTCSVSSGTSNWKVERPVPPGYAGAVNIHFTVGDYVLSCAEGSRTLKKSLRVTKT